MCWKGEGAGRKRPRWLPGPSKNQLGSQAEVTGRGHRLRSQAEVMG